MRPLSKLLNSVYPYAIGVIILLWLLSAGIFGVSTETADSLPSLFGGVGLLVFCLPLVYFSKLRLNFTLAAIVLISLLFFFWRASASLIEIYALGDGSLILLAALAWFVGVFAVKSRTYSAYLLLSLFLLLMVNGYAAYQQHLNPGWNLFGLVHPNPNQLTGLFFNRNYFGGFAAFCGCIFAGFCFWSNYSKWLRTLLSVCVVGSFFGAAISESRGALMAAAAGLGVFFALSMLLRVRLRLKFGALWASLSVVTVVLALVALAFAVSSTLEKRSNGSGVDQALASNGRTETLWLALKVGEDAPLIGFGARSFEYESIPRWESSSLWVGTGNLNFVHNEYGQVFADYGSVGLILLLVLILAHFGFGIWNVLKLSGRDLVGGASSLWGAYLTGGLSALVVVCVQANFSFVWHFPVFVVVCGVFAGAVGASGRARELSKNLIWLQRAAMTLAFCCIAFSMLSVGKKIYPGFVSNRIAQQEKQSRKQWLEGYVDSYPDWRAQKELSELARQRYTKIPEENLEKRTQLRAAAIEEYEKAFAMHPREPGLRLALADLLSQSGQFDDAEVHFKWVMANAESRQFWFNQHWIYGIHLYRWANQNFRSRQHRDALDKMKRARQELDRRRLRQNPQWKKQRQDIDKSIKYLEDEVIPYLPDP